MKKNNIITVERLPNGEIVQIMPDGSTLPIADKTDWVRLKNMTEAEIEEATSADPDNQPLTNKQLKKFHRIPNPKEIRQKLELTQEQFAIKFHLPLGTLRDWEQGAKQPDTAARSYLQVINKIPLMVMKALE